MEEMRQEAEKLRRLIASNVKNVQKVKLLGEQTEKVYVEIENAKLAVDLDPGTYACTAYFNNVNMETGEILGTAGAEIEITVKG